MDDLMERSTSRESMVLRNPSPDELRLLEYLACGSTELVAPEGWRATMMVADMNDGGMGSLKLFPDGAAAVDARFGKRASACQFTDEDGAEVIASLNIDQHGNFYELDIWKTDFGKVIQSPRRVDELRRENESAKADG